MKPLFQVDKIAQFKAIIAEVSTGSKPLDLEKSLAMVESEIKKIPDIKESKLLILLLSICIFGLSALLIYRGYYWPTLITVAWIGALLYYKVNERSLSIDALREKAKIVPLQYSTKINYLLSGIHQKQNRLMLMKGYNYAFWPFVIFMCQLFINNDSPLWILWIILLVIAIINAVFWHSFYKPQLSALSDIESDLVHLNSILLLSQGTTQYDQLLIQEEE